MENKKTKVAIIIVILLIITLIAVSYFYNDFNSKQVTLLTQELNEILDADLKEDSINFDSEGNELKIEDIYGTDEDIIHRCIESEEEEKLLVEEILKLNDRDKSIICKRYGLFGEKELTQKELANKMSISQSYISRIEKKVIRKLKLLLKI